MVAAILVLLGLVAGSVALANLSASGLLATRGEGSSKDARAVAEAGLASIIATLNQPENRKMLVSGTAMNSWATATGDTLQSPCVRNDGSRPGVANDGQATAAARSLGDNQFRNLTDNVVNTGERQYRLREVTYSVGAAGVADRRSIRTTTTAGSSALTQVGTGNFHELNNLEDPDGTGGNLPGFNSGFITLVVEGRVVRNGVVESTSTITREFEVLPKCCGASFGSNGSGGSAVGTAAGSLGSDSRFCGVQFGIITGINGGTHWSYFANDRFTTRAPGGPVVNLSTILGALKPGETLFQRSNCRVIPTPNNSACNPSQTSQDISFGSNFTGATPTANCIQPSGSTAFFPGMANDILGRSISCVPIVPISLSSLPRISDSSPGAGDGRYNYSWPTGSGPANRIAANNYPSISSSTADFKYVVRTNSTTSPPRVEVCQGNGVAPCSSGSWVNVSVDVPAGNVGDDLASAGYSGSTGTNLWNGAWVENDGNTSSAAQSPTAGDVRVVGGQIRLTDNSGSGRTVARRAAISRRLNLSGKSDPITLTFDFSQTGLSLSQNLVVEARPNSTASWTQLGATFRTNGPYSRTLPSLPSFATPTAEIRFRVNADIGDSDTALIDNIRISWPQIDAWCSYTATSPVTAAPGFHCLGPSVDLADGAQWLIDTTGGPLSFYYSQPTDTRGLSTASPLIRMSNSSSLAHVLCSSLQDNCTVPVGDDVFSPAGEPDQLNFFGRDRGASIVTQFIQVNSQFTSPVKISGVWFYFPEGDLTLDVNSCSPSQPANFYSDNNNWTFSGRVWVKNFKPCGAFHFRVPPSNLTNATSLFGAISFSGDTTFVDWSGVDWVARAVTASSNY